MKMWKIAVGVTAGVLAAAGLILLLVRHLQQLRELVADVREMCLGTEQEFGCGDACCYCGEEESDEPVEEAEEPAEPEEPAEDLAPEQA